MSVFPSFAAARTVVGFLALAGALTCPAQEATAVMPLSLADALDRVAANSPILAAERAGERAADALIEQAGYRPNPELEVSVENFAGTGGLRDFAASESTIEASQTIERGGKRAKRVAFASREREVAAREFLVRRTDMLTSAAIAYVETLAAQQRLALAEEVLRLAQETATAVDERVRAAIASPADAARARATLAMAQAEQARAVAHLQISRVTLASLWGGESTEVATLPGALHVPENLPAESSFKHAWASHPRVRLQQAISASRRASLALEQAQARPDLSVGAGVRFFREGSEAAWVAGVSMPLPIRHRNQGNIRAARERLMGAEQSEQAIEVELRTAFTGAWHAVAAAHAAALHLRASALPATEASHAIVRQAYEEGLLPLLDVLDAQRALIEVRRTLLDAASVYALALVRVDALTDPTFPATHALLAAR